MNDMSQVIIPKSDQWNADDFIAGPQTFTIQAVNITPGSEQPVNIVLEGTNKFYRPCKSMSRVLVGAWGADASKYVGRSLTLYRDPEVKWGGLAVGGIRISHMSDLDGAKTMVLTATKGSRKPFKVLPLAAAPAATTVDAAEKWTNAYIGKLQASTTLDDVAALENGQATRLTELKTKRPELHERIAAAAEARRGQLTPSDDLDAGFDEPEDRPTEPDPQTNDVSEADKSVDETIAAAKAAADSAALEAIIAESEKHKIALTDDQVMRLEIAFSQARARFAEALV